MVHFVGAGSGAADLITVRGAKLLGEADVVIYAGSLVNPALLDYTMGNIHALPAWDVWDAGHTVLGAFALRNPP